MNTLLCAGGSATRVLEAVLHLCAAGLGPDRLRLLRIDPDQSNGNATRVERLIETYRALHKALHGQLGPWKLFKTELEPLGTWSPVQPGDSLSKVLHYDVLPKNSQDVVRLLFSDAEREMVLDQGFRGHTPVGAAAMALVSRAAAGPPWDDLVQRLRNDLDATGARVFLAASVFGGTGASAIHPIARFLRSVPERNASQLKIGVAALVPYFRFRPSGGSPLKESDRPELAARSEGFALATKAAAHFYQHLRENKDWDFDAMYWIGDSTPGKDVPYAPGGPDQKNPAHFVDLLGALAGVEFFLDPEANAGRGCHFTGPRREVEAPPDENPLEWQDLPLRHLDRRVVKRALWRFFLCGVAHAGFWQEVLASEELQRSPHVVPWYYRYFRDPPLTGHGEREVLDRLGEFFAAFHLPFWGQVLDNRQVRLFNREAIPPDEPTSTPAAERRRVDLGRLRNLLWPDRGAGPGDDGVDAFFTEMIEAGRPPGTRGAAAYVSLLASAADRFVERQGGA